MNKPWDGMYRWRDDDGIERSARDSFLFWLCRGINKVYSWFMEVCLGVILLFGAVFMVWLVNTFVV